ncbi:hypothetical protein QFZ75_004445 [Streptomyces sp. V3I8]|uniref:hypothetical protein n=1 Tax=Streptomyces sp. V3I8 TaxID=3042279 RepID=UPI002785C5CE|nr:hypothetical protein [Streptomyces sp. V3I8]MDQ1038029.1 hypothetical protein [Streptomyces sp. V3I8]
MLDLTLRLLAKVLDACTPRPRGRHRQGALPPLRFIPVPPPRFSAIRSTGAAEFRRQRERRRALYLATVGIDIGPDCIHGVPMAAR